MVQRSLVEPGVAVLIGEPKLGVGDGIGRRKGHWRIFLVLFGLN